MADATTIAAGAGAALAGFALYSGASKAELAALQADVDALRRDVKALKLLRGQIATISADLEAVEALVAGVTPDEGFEIEALASTSTAAPHTTPIHPINGSVTVPLTGTYYIAWSCEASGSGGDNAIVSVIVDGTQIAGVGTTSQVSTSLAGTAKLALTAGSVNVDVQVSSSAVATAATVARVRVSGLFYRP